MAAIHRCRPGERAKRARTRDPYRATVVCAPCSLPIFATRTPAVMDAGVRWDHGRVCRHCEERSGEAIQNDLKSGMLRCARNDGMGSPVHEGLIIKIYRRNLVLLGPVILTVLPLRLVAALGQQVHVAH